jgi:hypothetical protein
MLFIVSAFLVFLAVAAPVLFRLRAPALSRGR